MRSSKFLSGPLKEKPRPPGGFIGGMSGDRGHLPLWGKGDLDIHATIDLATLSWINGEGV
jgi:hypothetical protein